MEGLVAQSAATNNIPWMMIIDVATFIIALRNRAARPSIRPMAASADAAAGLPELPTATHAERHSCD